MKIKKESQKKLNKSKEEFDKNKVKEFKTYIEAKFEEFSNNYIIIDFVNIHFHYKLGKGRINDDMNGELVFDFNYSHPYRQCHINIHQLAYDMWETGQLQTLEDSMLHELSHLHTHKLAELARNRFVDERRLTDTNEELTQIISEYVRRIKSLMQENINLKSRPFIKENKTKKETKKRSTKK